MTASKLRSLEYVQGMLHASQSPTAQARKRVSLPLQEGRRRQAPGSDTLVQGVSEACCGTRTLTVVGEESGSESVEQEQRMAPFGVFDVLVLTIGGHFLVKILTTWLKTREGVTKRQVQQ